MMLLLEWGGAALVVAGYYLFSKGRLTSGAFVSALAGVVLACWASAMGHWGVVALNAVVVLVNGPVAMRRHREGR